jgi:tripeptide aminopeptidase
MIDSEFLLSRFLSYVQIDTQSSIHSHGTPSTENQWALIRRLEAELITLGLSNVKVTKYGFVLATIPATSKKPSLPRVAFLAHASIPPVPRAPPSRSFINYDGNYRPP